MEAETIKKMALDAKEDQNCKEALRLFELSAQKMIWTVG